jgi:mitogen-activated protein kinase 1/3
MSGIAACAPTNGMVTSGAYQTDRPTPEKPPRSAPSKSQSAHGQTMFYGKPKSTRDEYEHDTLATASTAAATISYSTDEVNSDVSEAGMEVVVASKDSMMEDVSPSYTSHSFLAGKHSFTVDTRYSLIRVIGSGAYGVVISAHDAKTQTNVAIKMVPKAFNDEVDAKRILREIKLLKHFHHENIVSIVDMMPPQAQYVEDFQDVYIVADLMETDLHRIIYSKQKLSIDHVQYFIYQVLRGLKYIHSANVLHRDLKPSNLLVNSNCDLKICDFGLARGIYPDHDERKGGTMLLTEYVVTRWYRAPEIMLACHEYSKPVDVWSVGCIFAELILRKPYFPGDDYIDQVRRDGRRHEFEELT